MEKDEMFIKPKILGQYLILAATEVDMSRDAHIDFGED